MNDDPGPTSAEDESPEIAEVRHLLGEARHTEPMPEDVAARMDRVLARLGDERPAARPEPTSGDVVPIAAHRRRAVQLLVAAAALVVGGVVLSQNYGPAPDRGATAGSEAQADTSAGRSAPNAPQAEQPGNYAPSRGVTNQLDALPMRRGRLVVRPQHFAADALRGRALLAGSDTAAKADQMSLLRRCVVGDSRDAQALAAEYQNAPAALVFRRPEGNVQVVDLYVCGSSTPIRTTTLPAP